MTALDTKTLLLDAAESFVRQNGADGFSYADLAKEVGIRKASIHYHFPAKSDILRAIMARYAKTVAAELDSFSQTMPQARDQLQAFIALYRAALKDGTALCLCVAYTVSQDHLGPDTQEEMQKFRSHVLGWLREVLALAKSQDAPVLVGGAAALLALVEGAQIAARISGDMRSYDQATEGLIDSVPPLT